MTAMICEYQKSSHADKTNAGYQINKSSTIKTDMALTAVRIKCNEFNNKREKNNWEVKNPVL